MLAQLFEEGFQGEGRGHGEDLRARSHHLADQLVAELDGGADQFAVALLEDALFFAGFEQRLDIGCCLLFGSDRLLGQRGYGEEEAHEDGDGRHQPEQQTDGPDDIPSPAAFGAVEEQRGQKMVAEDHHQHHCENGLGDLTGGGAGQIRRAIKEQSAELESDEAQGELLQDCRADRRVAASEAQLRFDQLLPGVEVFFDFAGENLAELAVDAADV